jgi:phenylpropionate dioxygenase-like ring-hydroxylating dioxygenase large terminal subunit
MLTTKQTLFRRFWHAVIPLADLRDGPQPFRLLGEDIVLFLDVDGKPAALKDRCCHRTARLSKGWCVDGELVCGYHGWTYAANGQVTKIPQLETLPGVRHATPAYRCTARYGYAWVALEDPLLPIFDIPEDAHHGFRRIPQFYERWATAPMRLMENSFDSAHIAFVHRRTFGDQNRPAPSVHEIEETDDGFVATRTGTVVNPPSAHRVTGSTDPTTVRMTRNHWYLPFCRRLHITYPSGVQHIIFTCATPIDDDQMQVVQFLYRNDSEADCPAQLLIDWDAQIIAEDKAVLESTEAASCLDVARRIETHMPSDRPGIVMRRRLLELLRANGEDEVLSEAEIFLERRSLVG